MTQREPSVTTPFAEPAVVDAAVVELIASRPAKTWTAADLVDCVEHTALDVMMGLARLSSSGQIERTAPGRYRLRHVPTTLGEAADP